MNRVYQLEFHGDQAFLFQLPSEHPIVFHLNNDNHDLCGLTQATAEINKHGEEVVSVVGSGSSGDGIRPRFLIVTKMEADRIEAEAQGKRELENNKVR